MPRRPYCVRRRERLEKSYSQVIEEESRAQRRKTIQQASDEFLLEYKVKHESPTFAVYALGHVTDHLAKKLVVEITPAVVKGYQTSRLAEKVSRVNYFFALTTIISPGQRQLPFNS